MNTITTLQSKFNTETMDHLLADADVPVLTGAQRQGDILIFPMRPGKVDGLVQVPSEGYPVVRGENGGNTHRLLAEGKVSYAPNTQRGQRLGTLVVEKGATAWLEHPEHGFNGIGAGTYIINRQREQADEIRLVAD